MLGDTRGNRRGDAGADMGANQASRMQSLITSFIVRSSLGRAAHRTKAANVRARASGGILASVKVVFSLLAVAFLTANPASLSLFDSRSVRDARRHAR